MKAPSPLAFARGLALKAGRTMRRDFTLNMKKEWKEDATPVTSTDGTINDLVLTSIKRAFPDHRILSEEGDDLSGDSEYTWICDPVDGTHNFAHGIPTATFALALVKGDSGVLSIIYDPFLDRMFAAEKGKGAFLNGEPIRVSSGSSLRNSVIGLGKMNKARNFFPLAEALYARDVRMLTGLSIHYMYALVACGEFAAAFFGGTSPHDITPGKILVEEAGGGASDLSGRPPERLDGAMDGQLVSNGAVHKELLELLDTTSSQPR